AEDIRDHLGAIPAEELRASFWYDSLDEEDSCHNYHAFQAVRYEAAFREKRAVIDRLLSNIAERLQNPLSRRGTLYREVVSLSAGDPPPVSRGMLQALQSKVQPVSCSSGQEGQAPRHALPSLHCLTQVIDEQFPELSSAVGNHESCLELWRRIWQEEGELRRKIEQGRVRLGTARAKFNLPQQAAALWGLAAVFSGGEGRYENLCQRPVEVTRQAFDEVRKELGSIQEHFGGIDGLVWSELWQPFVLRRGVFLGASEKRLRACEAVGSLPEALRTRFAS